MVGCDGAGVAKSGTAKAGSGKAGTVRLEKVGEFRRPLYATSPPGSGDLYVVEKGGKVRVLRDGKTLPHSFLDIRRRVNSGGVEQGLLSLAFAPDYARSHLFYVDYIDNAGDTQVVELRRSAQDPLRADPGSARHVLSVHQPAPIHNGGLLLFGPDRNLYIGLGDGGPSYDPYRTAQAKRSFLGKILRIDPRRHGDAPYSVPKSNPFAKGPGWDEVFAYGLRNPWRFSFDRETGDLLIGDVGQDSCEEIDYRPARKAAGSNFGWSAYEGYRVQNRGQIHKARNQTRPVLVYKHGPGCSVTGGYVVRDPGLPSLWGRYLYGDYCAGDLRTLIPALPRAKDDRPLGLNVPALSSFAQDSTGHIYVVSLLGPVYRLVPK
jgi:glucose/arabinose dehydrogenase